MKNVFSLRLSAVVAALLLLVGCASRQVDPATLGPDVLYQRATSFYEGRRFDRAIPLLEAFVQQHLGDPRAPQAQLLLGKSYMARREYVTAATQFQRLVESFPSSPLNLEARASICQAYIALSPEPQLDQEYTRAALSHCESVASYFPGTPEAEQASRSVAELREKLARKVYETGLFYRKRRALDAAVVYFTDVLDRYPQSQVAPAALQQLMETYQLLGYVEEAQQARERLLRDYPQSEEARALQA